MQAAPGEEGPSQVTAEAAPVPRPPSADFGKQLGMCELGNTRVLSDTCHVIQFPSGFQMRRVCKRKPDFSSAELTKNHSQGCDV